MGGIEAFIGKKANEFNYVSQINRTTPQRDQESDACA